MPPLRSVLTGLVLAACVATLGCDDLFNPCARYVGDSELMDGVWKVTRINGSAIPALGYKVNDTDYLRSGSMDFRTREVLGACVSPSKTDGSVLARFVLGTASGQLTPGNSAAANYTFTQYGDLSLRAYGVTLSSQVVGNSFTLAGINPDGFRNVTITFSRESRP